MKQKILLTITVLILLFFACKASSASAATYFMRADGTATNKTQATGPATDKTKCMNISTHNSQTFAPGDTILLSSEGGDYRTKIIVPSSGSEAGGYITYTNVPDETPIFENNITVSGSWTDLGNGRYSISTGAAHREGLFEDDIPLQKGPDANLATGNWFYHTVSHTLYYKPTSGTPNSHTVKVLDWDFASDCIGVANRSWIKFVKSGTGTLHFKRSKAAIGGLINSASTENIVVDGLYFEYCADATFFNIYNNSYNSSGIFRNNTGYRCRSFFRVYSDLGTGTHNTWDVYNNVGDGIGSIDGDTSWEMGDQEYAGFQNAHGCSIYKNIATNGFSDFVHLYTRQNSESRDNNVFGNFVHNNKRRIICIAGTSPAWKFSNNRIYNNVSYNHCTTMNWNWMKYQYFYARPLAASETNYLYNNTVIGGEIGLYCGSGASESLYLTSKNNIFRGMTIGNIYMNMTNPSDYLFDNNCYDSKNISFNGSKTLLEWQNASGQDKQSFVSDPLLANPTGTSAADYRLQSTSPAIDKGANVGLTADFAGTSVPQGSAPDIGAFEYKSGSPTFSASDINSDGTVGVTDLGILMTDFLKTAANALNPRSDINSDGTISITDLGILMSEWK